MRRRAAVSFGILCALVLGYFGGLVHAMRHYERVIASMPVPRPGARCDKPACYPAPAVGTARKVGT